MHCVVINGTEVKGCTYHLKEMLLEEIRPKKVTEFYLPKDAPAYCTGCKLCFEQDENLCPHVDKVKPIWEAMKAADLILFAYPVYALRTPGHVKSLLDHLAVHWIVHRPDPIMFTKTAILLTQSIGGPNGAAQRDVKTSLHWMGVPSVSTLGFTMRNGVIWDKIPRERKRDFHRKIRKFAKNYRVVQPKKLSLKGKAIFRVVKTMRKNAYNKLTPGEVPYRDLAYWMEKGWI